jgi:cell division protein FtsI/penicillin-binding protein 2
VAEEDKVLTLDCTFADDALVKTSTSPIKGISRLMTAREKEQAIEDLFNRKELVDIVTHTKVYSNMIMIDRQSEVTAKNSKGYDVTLVFQKIQTVNTGTASVVLDKLKKKKPPPGPNDAAVKAALDSIEAQMKERNKGKQDVKEATPEDKEKARSLLIGMIG